MDVPDLALFLAAIQEHALALRVIRPKRLQAAKVFGADGAGVLDFNLPVPRGPKRKKLDGGA
jgi:hypothetical protein